MSGPVPHDAALECVAAIAANVWHWVISANNFWSAFFAATAGALVAFEVERRHKRRERLSRECAKANRLIATLGRMLSMLEDLQETLFDEPARKLGHAPRWHELGGLLGLPQRVPRIDVADYDFLLETEDPSDRAAEMLGHIEHAQTLLDAILTMLRERTELAFRFQEIGPSAALARGEAAIGPGSVAAALERRLKELTAGLASDVPVAISTIKEIVPKLRAALMTRYPHRQFLLLIPADPKAPPL